MYQTSSRPLFRCRACDTQIDINLNEHIMKQLIKTSFVLLAIVVCACKSTETINPIPANHVVLQSGKSSVASVGITVFADTVNMFICPKMAACFAPDNVSASVRLVRNQESQRVRLFAGFGGPSRRDRSLASDSTSVRFGGQLYKVILKGEYIGEDDKGRLGRALLQVAPLN